MKRLKLVNRFMPNPPNSRRVVRPSKYGNPYRVGDIHPDTGERMTAADAVTLFECHTLPNLDLAPLVGLDLICGCDLDKPCHANSIIKAIEK